MRNERGRLLRAGPFIPALSVALLLSGGLACGPARRAAAQPPFELPKHERFRVVSSNLIPNGGFEEADSGQPERPAGWITATADWNQHTFWTSEEARSGAYSVKITATDTRREHVWVTGYLPIDGGRTYKFSIWAKHPDPTPHGIIVAAYFVNRDKECPVPPDEPRAEWSNLSFTYGGPCPWRRFSRYWEAPADAAYVRIYLRLYRTAGTVYYDDASLKEIEK